MAKHHSCVSSLTPMFWSSPRAGSLCQAPRDTKTSTTSVWRRITLLTPPNEPSHLSRYKWRKPARWKWAKSREQASDCTFVCVSPSRMALCKGFDSGFSDMLLHLIIVKEVYITQENEEKTRRESILRDEWKTRETPKIKEEPKTREDFMKCEFLPDCWQVAHIWLNQAKIYPQHPRIMIISWVCPVCVQYLKGFKCTETTASLTKASLLAEQVWWRKTTEFSITQTNTAARASFATSVARKLQLNCNLFIFLSLFKWTIFIKCLCRGMESSTQQSINWIIIIFGFFRLSPVDSGCQQHSPQPPSLWGEPNSYNEEWAQELPHSPGPIRPLAAGRNSEKVEKHLPSQGKFNTPGQQTFLLSVVPSVPGVEQGEHYWESLLLGGGLDWHRDRHCCHLQGNSPKGKRERMQLGVERQVLEPLLLGFQILVCAQQ